MLKPEGRVVKELVGDGLATKNQGAAELHRGEVGSSYKEGNEWYRKIRHGSEMVSKANN